LVKVFPCLDPLILSIVNRIKYVVDCLLCSQDSTFPCSWNTDYLTTVLFPASLEAASSPLTKLQAVG